ncbi:hypothetical protein H5410_033572 [Solanum commersonii]|uniref:Uncharacterized protein n=1 Tax=Solanum commersonii TaxID=4109 RepID=A0A9J5YP07_SOLCO|nr:hypothetical protein H5410_033572 [Solanum commersonii]
MKNDTSIWTHKTPIDCRWYWRKINALKEHMHGWYNHIRYMLTQTDKYSITKSYQALMDPKPRWNIVELVWTCYQKKTSQNVLCACDFDMRFTFVAAGWEDTAHDSKVLENAFVEPTSQFPFPPYGTDDIFMVYENENVVADDIDRQMTQSNNVGSTSRSHDREMQVQREEIVRTMWEDYIKD